MVNKRGKLISQIDALNKEIVEIKQAVTDELGIKEFNFSNIKGKINPLSFETLKKVTSMTKTLLENMIKADEEILKRYKEKLNYVKGKLMNIRNSKKALSAYKVNNNHARFLDKKK